MKSLRKFFNRRCNPQPPALANPESNTVSPRGDPQHIGIFNGADTVIINGGIFIFNFVGNVSHYLNSKHNVLRIHQEMRA